MAVGVTVSVGVGVRVGVGVMVGVSVKVGRGVKIEIGRTGGQRRHGVPADIGRAWRLGRRFHGRGFTAVERQLHQNNDQQDEDNSQ